MAENPRTESARAHDDTDLIEGMIPGGEAVPSSAGGRLATDVGTQNDLTRAVSDEDAMTRPQKADDQHADQSYRADRRG